MGKQGGKERGARGQGLGVGGALLDRWIRGRGDQREGRQAWSRGGPRQSRGSLACKHLFPIMEKPRGFLFELSLPFWRVPCPLLWVPSPSQSQIQAAGDAGPRFPGDTVGRSQGHSPRQRTPLCLPL